MKNCKTFYENQIDSHLKEIIQPSPTPPHPTPIPPDKILLRLWNKHFLREIYRNIQTFAFEVLQESSSWSSGNRAVQMFFLTPNRNMFAGKFVHWENFLAVFWEHIISISKELRFAKWVRFFWAKLYCKMSNLFSLVFIGFEIFCNKIWNKKSLMMSIGTCGLKLYARNNIFKKRITNMRFWIIYILVQISFFGGLLQGVLASVFFLFFRHRSAMVSDIFTQSSFHHKKASYGPVKTKKIRNV